MLNATTPLRLDEFQDWDSSGKGSDGTWFVGIMMIFVSGFASVLGLLVSKLAHLVEQEKPPEEQQSNICKRPLMWVGVLIAIFLPAPLDIGALLFCRYSLIAPFASFPVVLNAIGGRILFGEDLTWRVEGVSTLLIIAGCVMTTFFGGHGDGRYITTGCESHAVWARDAPEAAGYGCLCLHGGDTVPGAAGGAGATAIGGAVGAVGAVGVGGAAGVGGEVLISDNTTKSLLTWSGVNTTACPLYVCNCFETRQMFSEPMAIGFVIFSCFSMAAAYAVWVMCKPKGEPPCCCTSDDRAEKHEQLHDEVDDVAAGGSRTGKGKGSTEELVVAGSTNAAADATDDDDDNRSGGGGGGSGSAAKGRERRASTGPKGGLHGTSKWVAYGFAYIGACAGALQQILLKTVVELIKTSAEPGTALQLATPDFWIFLAIGIALAFAQASTLQCGYNYFDTVFFTPIYSALLVLMGVLSGMLIYGDGANMTSTDVALFAIAVLLILFGTAWMSNRKNLQTGSTKDLPVWLKRHCGCCCPAARAALEEEEAEAREETARMSPRSKRKTRGAASNSETGMELQYTGVKPNDSV